MESTFKDWKYTSSQKWACPDCYAPVSPPKRKRDGRCGSCTKSLHRKPKKEEQD